MKKLILFSAFIAMSGCSPFGNQSLVEQISKAIEAVLPQKTSTSMLSSASSTLTAGGFVVTHSVGDQYQQDVSGTIAVDSGTLVPTGYRVYSNIQGTQTQ